MSEFSGTTYQPELDRERLTKQRERVFWLMTDHQWRTLREISTVTGDPESSVSARLRDIRNKLGMAVERRRRAGFELSGVFEYRVRPAIEKGDL